MKKYVVDTNAFLRFFLNDIPEQKKLTENLLQQAKESKITLFVPQIVIFELHFILEKYYSFDKESIISTLQVLISVDYLEIESKETFLTALTSYKSVSISFVDCFLLSKTKQENAELFTFDRKLQKLQ